VGATAAVDRAATGTAALDASITVLVNELADVPDEVVLVVDDYHVVESCGDEPAAQIWPGSAATARASAPTPRWR
jgi:hypothetical protein